MTRDTVTLTGTKRHSTVSSKTCMVSDVIVTEEIGTKPLTDLIQQVQAGDQIVLTQDAKPVAKLISALEKPNFSHPTRSIRSLRGHRVLPPVISQAELAEELFDRERAVNVQSF